MQITTPLRSRIFSHYVSIEVQVKRHTMLPSFFSCSAGAADTFALKWNGTNYSITLTDFNDVLGNYTFFSGKAGMRFSVDGNRLTTSCDTAPKGAVSVTTEKVNGQRSGVVVRSDGTSGGSTQDFATYGATVSDPVSGLLKLEVMTGSMKLIKTSEDGKVEGIRFTVTKTSEDGLVEGMKFRLYGTSLSGLPVDKYAVTDAGGVAKFEDVLIGSGYVLEEVDTAIRYVVPEAQSAAVNWNEVTGKSFQNILKKFRVTRTKSDVKTGTAQGNAPLAGATYGLYIFGLLPRQTIFSALAVAVAVGVYFGLRGFLGTETVSWMCILCAAPFAALGFLKYNGMSAEKFLAAWLRSEFLLPKTLRYAPVNLYAELNKQGKEESRMAKGLQKLFHRGRERVAIPKSAQEAIPLKAVYEDGVFGVSPSTYSMTVRFFDINYSVASREDKEAMFLAWSEVLNAIASNVLAKLSVVCKKVNRQDYEKLMLRLRGDGLDDLRKEYNQMLVDKITDSGNMVEELYFTFTIQKCSVEEARKNFRRIVTDLSAHFRQLGRKCVELSAVDRLRIAHDFYRHGEEANFHLDFRKMMKRGHSVKDYICPDGFEFEADHFKMGPKFDGSFCCETMPTISRTALFPSCAT